MNITSPIMIDQVDIKPIDKVVKLVSGRDIEDLNQNDISYIGKLYYDTIRLMKAGKICCFSVK